MVYILQEIGNSGGFGLIDTPEIPSNCDSFIAAYITCLSYIFISVKQSITGQHPLTWAL